MISRNFGVLLAVAVPLLGGCVQGGTNGARSNYINAAAGSLSERRDALKSVSVVKAQPAGMTSIGEVTTDRCHRYFTEEPPSEGAIVSDLKFLAYGQGADAMRIVKISTEPGLVSNCWHILRGTAEIYSRR